MKKITMTESRCGNSWEKTGTREFYRVSRWIKVKQNYNPSKNNALWEFVTDGYGYKAYDVNFNPVENGGKFLDYFTFNGKNYAVEQFYSLGNPFFMPVLYTYEENGKLYNLSGVDMYGDLYSPIYVEFDEYCERVRVYREV